MKAHDESSNEAAKARFVRSSSTSLCSNFSTFCKAGNIPHKSTPRMIQCKDYIIGRTEAVFQFLSTFFQGHRVFVRTALKVESCVFSAKIKQYPNCLFFAFSWLSGLFVKVHFPLILLKVSLTIHSS